MQKNLSLSEIHDLASKGESESFEFKKSTGQLHAACETLCAFLNGKGGTVIMGVTDQGRVTGQEISDRTKQEIANEISKIEPHPQISIQYIDLEKNKKIISLSAEINDYAPYTYDGRAFYREQTVTKKMSQHRYEQLLIARGQLNYAWEEAIAPEYKLSDLDEEEIYKTVSDGIKENRLPASAQREDIPQILKRLNLISEGKLKRAAVVLYAKQSSLTLVQCMIKMARFRGTDKLGEFIDNKQIYGNAFFLLSEADAFQRRHLPIASTFRPDQFKRVDKPALPVMALREALINAICHRDYAERGTDISLAIFDDHLEIWNSGTLSKGLSIEALKGYHASVLRNKLIANVFYVRGMIEKWGSGTNKMIDLCTEASVPEPKFIEHTGGLAVIFKFQAPISITDRKMTNNLLLNVRQKEILRILRTSKPLSASEIFSKLKKPPSLRTVKSDLSSLHAFNLIEQQGKGPSTLWKIREV